MKKALLIFLLGTFTLLISGCVSAWMTASTGKEIYFKEGMHRSDVLAVLGAPELRSEEVDIKYIKEFRYQGKPISYVEIHNYRGKINAVDEGGAQATLNALTLGTGEVVMIPLTALSIASRSIGKHNIHVFYANDDTVVGFRIDPKKN